MEEKYILSLDIGTTTIRSFIYNSRTEIVGKAVDQVVLHYPKSGYVEIDPDELWTSVVGVVKSCLQNAKLTARQVTAMGISTQRSTFITWSRSTGKPFHRFITWKDIRADELVRQWNDSYTWKLFKLGAYILFFVSRSKRFYAGSVLKFSNNQTTLRLHWALLNIPELKAALQKNDALFGTLDTWLLYKMTGSKLHMTDVSSASATGFFDPFTMQWSGWGMSFFDIPQTSLPKVVDTAGDHFTSTAEEIWGHAIPIRCVIADQTASMWGSCCFNVGDVKLTMGTGTFLNINTGSKPHASVSGLYPVVGWRLGDELIYSAEGANNDTASIIKWAQNLGSKLHMTDVSSASATGFFDPFTMQWSGWGMSFFDIPQTSLPKVVDTAGDHFTSTAEEIWGHAIPIRCVIADQTASMWGSCCFNVGDVKLTMGTGTFLNINTGSKPHASVSGLYPVVGWRLGDELIYSAEGANNDTASIIKWAQNLGLFDNPQDTAEIAMSVPDTDDVFFIPAFSGLGPPYNDGTAASGFVGVKATTRKPHLVRAVLEALAFRTAQLHACARDETSFAFTTIRLDGGVSNNDFVVQLIADLTGLCVERPAQVEMSSLGCAHIVGLHLGIFSSKEELKSLRKVSTVFTPRPQVKKAYEGTIARWEDAVKRMRGWYVGNKSSQSQSSVYDSNNSINSQNSFKVTFLKKNGRSK